MTKIFCLPNPRFVVAIVSLLIASFSLHAECTMEKANTIIRDFYGGMDALLSSQTSSKSLLVLKNKIDPLLPYGWTDETADVHFPNEPHRLFNNDRTSSYLTAKKYFSTFDQERLSNIATDSEKEKIRIKMNVDYGATEAISQPTTFNDDPSKRGSLITHWRMKLTKTYFVVELNENEQETNASKRIVLHDNIAVRYRDGKIVRLRNECGGSAEFTADELNYEGLLLEATDAWNDHRYQEAYRLYRKVIELKPQDPPARACFHLGLMMYDQWKGRAVYDSDIDRKKAGQYAANYMKKGSKMTDEPSFAKECYRAYYNIITTD